MNKTWGWEKGKILSPQQESNLDLPNTKQGQPTEFMWQVSCILLGLALSKLLWLSVYMHVDQFTFHKNWMLQSVASFTTALSGKQESWVPCRVASIFFSHLRPNVGPLTRTAQPWLLLVFDTQLIWLSFISRLPSFQISRHFFQILC